MINVKYVNIDDWNRPVFKGDDNKYYGCTFILFPYCESEPEVLKKITANDLVYFGNKFNCEPYGSPVSDIKIISKEEGVK